jgi:hypothetical protein
MQNGEWVISGDDNIGSVDIRNSGLVKDDNAANVMDGYSAYTYTNAEEDIHVYIQQEIKLITGDS